jgi:uncharacterized protein YdeI (YjbR/CyaY-like superfamily)
MEEPQFFESKSAFARWLAKHHDDVDGVWIAMAKRATKTKSITYAEALDVALAWGWIDAQRRGGDREWLIRFTPRRARSRWSKINRAKAEALVASGAMKPPGLAEIERAKKDGRWDAAYDSPKTAEVPSDLERALSKNALARKRFATLDSRNRYAILYRVESAKKPETRAKRIADFVAMLAKGELLYP